MSIPGNQVSASASTHSFVVQLAKTRSNFKMQTTVVLMLHSEGTLWQRFLVHLLSWMKFEDILKTLPTSNLNLKALQETTKRHETFRIVLSKEVARGGGQQPSLILVNYMVKYGQFLFYTCPPPSQSWHPLLLSYINFNENTFENSTLCGKSMLYIYAAL